MAQRGSSEEVNFVCFQNYLQSIIFNVELSGIKCLKNHRNLQPFKMLISSCYMLFQLYKYICFKNIIIFSVWCYHCISNCHAVLEEKNRLWVILTIHNSKVVSMRGWRNWSNVEIAKERQVVWMLMGHPHRSILETLGNWGDSLWILKQVLYPKV